MGSVSNPGRLASHSAPCLWPGKAVEDGSKPWDPAPKWETRKRLLAPGFGSAHLWRLWPLGEWIIGQKVFLSISPLLCISDFPIKIDKPLKGSLTVQKKQNWSEILCIFVFVKSTVFNYCKISITLVPLETWIPSSTRRKTLSEVFLRSNNKQTLHFDTTVKDFSQ